MSFEIWGEKNVKERGYTMVILQQCTKSNILLQKMGFLDFKKQLLPIRAHFIHNEC